MTIYGRYTPLGQTDQTIEVLIMTRLVLWPTSLICACAFKGMAQGEQIPMSSIHVRFQTSLQAPSRKSENALCLTYAADAGSNAVRTTCSNELSTSSL